MKAYVIKNKEGKYWSGFPNGCYVKDISSATIYRENELFELLHTSESWQEVTLCEGDLEKETIHKIFDIINGLYNTFGWIEDVRFDEFKDKVLEEYEYNYSKGEKDEENN